MENMKSLADQIREELVKPEAKRKPASPKSVSRPKTKDIIAPILAAIQSYDTSKNKNMVHVRFDEQTVKIMNHFKMATGIDVTRLVAFSVHHLMETHPDIKLIIKHFIQNTEL